MNNVSLNFMLPGFRTLLNRNNRWYTLYQKMNMVFVSPYFNELDLIPLRNLKANVFQTLVYRLAEYNPPIFGWTHKVVEKY